MNLYKTNEAKKKIQAIVQLREPRDTLQAELVGEGCGEFDVVVFATMFAAGRALAASTV